MSKNRFTGHLKWTRPIGENVKKWKFSDIWMIFTEKSTSHAENRDLWKITKNVTTHHQIVRFGSFLDMLALATSRIDFCDKILIFSFFSKKSRIFSQNLQKSQFFAENSRFFAEKCKYQNFLTKIYTTGCKDQYIRKWAKSDYLVMSCYIFRDFSQIAIFSMGGWFFSENHPYIAEFSLFLHFRLLFSKVFTKLVFWSNL